MIRYILDTETGDIQRQTPAYNPAAAVTIDGETGLPVVTPNPRYIVCREVVEPQPPYDPATQRLRSVTRADAAAAQVIRGWEIQDRPPAPPVAEWQQFHADLRAMHKLRQAIAALGQVDAMAFLAVGAGLVQAVDGDPRTFGGTWGGMKAAGLVPPALAAAVLQRAQAANLPADFIAVL